MLREIKYVLNVENCDMSCWSASPDFLCSDFIYEKVKLLFKNLIKANLLGTHQELFRLFL